MVAIEPQHVVVHDSVLRDPACLARLERLLTAFPLPKPLILDDRRMDEFVASRAYPSRLLWGEREQPRDPDLFFLKERFDTPEEHQRRARAYPHLGFRNLLGYGGVGFRRDGTTEWRAASGTVCQPAWELHSASGCPFRCSYCWFGDAISLRLNIEEQLAHLPEAFAHAPEQALWKWDNQSDVNAFEPEWDAVRPMIERFAQEEARWLLLYTGKSDNVEVMLDLDHRGHTVVCWSLSPRTQAERMEPRTATAHARVEAAARCQAAGYPVRFRFSPIIPVAGWREEYRELIAWIFAGTRPDVISLCPFGWMDLPQAERCLDTSLLDPEALAMMRKLGKDPDWHGGHGSPIPFAYRRVMLDFLIDEIQRYDTDTEISICLDTPRMWESLGERIGQGPESYFCNCGGHCRPKTGRNGCPLT